MWWRRIEELLTPALGRKEMVEALLLDIERRGKHSTPPLDPAIIAGLRDNQLLATVVWWLSRLASSFISSLIKG